jgi:Na+-driven multidrug efflux pump
MFTNKQIVFLIIPLIIDMLLSTIVGFVDTLMVSSVGEAAVSSVSLVDTINRMFIFLFSALSTGGTILASQFMGRRDSENARKAGRQIFMLTLMISTTVAVICMASGKWILTGLYGSVDPDVMQGAIVYFLITAASYPFMSLFGTCSALFRATRNTKLPMFVSALMNGINIGLNALFIYRMHMGVMGAALGTLLARVIAVVVIYFFIQRPKTVLNLRGILSYRRTAP